MFVGLQVIIHVCAVMQVVYERADKDMSDSFKLPDFCSSIPFIRGKD